MNRVLQYLKIQLIQSNYVVVCSSTRNIRKLVWIQAIMTLSLGQPYAWLCQLITDKQKILSRNMNTRSRDSLMTRPLDIE